MGDKIKYIEIFYSIQGEGVNFGVPSVFLRLPYCNLRCKWCDTKYALDPEEVHESDPSSLCVLLAFRRDVAKNVVITGGEPMLQQAALAPLVKMLDESKMFVEIETNGTIPPIPEIIEHVGWFNVSPKLSNSGVAKSLRTRAPALKAYSELSRRGKAWFKFVIRGESDVEELLQEYLRPYNIPEDRVLLMPLTEDYRLDRERTAAVIELCKKYGFRFSPRIQVDIYGDRRLV